MNIEGKKKQGFDFHLAGSTLCVGGFVGWYLTVMYICEKSLEVYGVSDLFAYTCVLFGAASLAVLLITLLIMMYLDFEGILGHRYFRFVPAVIMAESGLALAFTNADSFGIYACITGMCSAFGAIAAFSTILSVKVGKRLFSVAMGVAIGGAVRFADALIYSNMDMTRGIYVLSAVSGVLALLTVRSSGFSKESVPLISYSEMSPSKLLVRIPGSYVFLFAISLIYYFTVNSMTSIAEGLYASSFNMYDVLSCSAYVAAAVLIAFFARFYNVTPVYIFGMCLTAYAAILLQLPYFAPAEEGFYLVFNFAGQAFFQVFIYIAIVMFSMDKPHKLFFTVVGYAVVVTAQLVSNVMYYFSVAQSETGILVSVAVLVILGGPLIFSTLKKQGITQESFERRSALKRTIRSISKQKQLSDREEYLLELVALDNYTVEQLPDRMMLSRNTVRAQVRSLVNKLGIDDASGIKPFLEDVMSAENAAKL